MRFSETKKMRALLALTVTAVVVLPVAIAGANGSKTAHDAGKRHAKVTAVVKQIRSLKQKMAHFAAVRSELAQQLATLEGNAGALAGQSLPTSLPPSGPAGGALTGKYPAPSLALNSVGAPNIVNGEVRSSDLADRSITSVDLAKGSVSGLDLKNTQFVVGERVEIKRFETKQVTATCPGESRLVSGGFEWARGANNTAIVFSAPNFQNPNKAWTVSGHVDQFPGEDNELIAEALCLEK